MAETEARDDKYGHEYHRLRSLTGAYEIRQHSVSKSNFRSKKNH
jgi:hypothetical protein